MQGEEELLACVRRNGNFEEDEEGEGMGMVSRANLEEEQIHDVQARPSNLREEALDDDDHDG
jgi:hypothetical protein